MRELIVTGAIQNGERLPTVEVLTQEFAVSWTAAREALRILESEGLVSVQRGKRGGAIVRHPDADTAAYAVALALRSRRTPLRDIFEAQGHVEPLCAMLCARRPDRNETVVPELRAANAQARQVLDGDESDFLSAMEGFHSTLATGCGSNSMALIGGMLESIALAMLTRQAEFIGVVSPHVDRVNALDFHERLCDLIEVGADLQAAQVMSEHARESQVLSEHLQAAVGGTVLDEVVDPAIVRRNS